MRLLLVVHPVAAEIGLEVALQRLGVARATNARERLKIEERRHASWTCCRSRRLLGTQRSRVHDVIDGDETSAGAVEFYYFESELNFSV